MPTKRSMIMKSGITLAVIGFAICFFCRENLGADWTVNSANENFTYLYDQEKIEEISSGILRIWQKWLPSPKEVEKMVQEDALRYTNWDHSLLLTELDCGKRHQRLLAILEYDKNGNVTYIEDYSDSDWIFLIPGSVGEALFEAICPWKQGR